jgi:hypothetical protein
MWRAKNLRRLIREYLKLVNGMAMNIILGGYFCENYYFSISGFLFKYRLAQGLRPYGKPEEYVPWLLAKKIIK